MLYLWRAVGHEAEALERCVAKQRRRHPSCVS
nr:hypothetical protein [uncultured Croceicoccus sp.]